MGAAMRAVTPLELLSPHFMRLSPVIRMETVTSLTDTQLLVILSRQRIFILTKTVILVLGPGGH